MDGSSTSTACRWAAMALSVWSRRPELSLTDPSVRIATRRSRSWPSCRYQPSTATATIMPVERPHDMMAAIKKAGGRREIPQREISHKTVVTPTYRRRSAGWLRRKGSDGGEERFAVNEEPVRWKTNCPRSSMG